MTVEDRKFALALRLFNRVFPPEMLKETASTLLEKQQLSASLGLRVREQFDYAADKVARELAGEWARVRSEEEIVRLLERTESPFFDPRAMAREGLLAPWIEVLSRYISMSEVLH